MKFFGLFKRKGKSDLKRKEALKQVLYGSTLAKAKQYDEAIPIFRQAINSDPECAEAHFALGLMYAYKGMDKEAAMEYDRAIKADPRYKEVLSNIGISYKNEFDLLETLKKGGNK